VTDGLPTVAHGSLAARIGAVFNRTFDAWHTVMIGGGAEPLYRPARGAAPARIVFTRDYAASALHEAAHWCIAGADRRRRLDYGYAYQPPPRSARQLREFFRSELTCQALELVFSEAVGMRFRVSVDDLDAPPGTAAAFERDVRAAAVALRRAPPARAARFLAALRAEFEPERSSG
jgi:elongation factor P hydroxylase